MTNLAYLEPAPADYRPVNQLVGMNVAVIAQIRGRTQRELAEACGVTQSSMSRRIAGTTDWSPDDMQKVADLLNVRISRLFEKLPDLDSNQEPAG